VKNLFPGLASLRRVVPALAVAGLVGALGLVAERCAAEPRSDAFSDNLTFILPVANFEPIPADAFADDPQPPFATKSRSSSTPSRVLSNNYELDAYELSPPPYESADDCDSCGCGSTIGPLPNGQIPDNWMWGCGGSPFRTGPGTCDDWKVGPVWDVSVDAMVLFRDSADLVALHGAIEDSDPGDMLSTPRETQFGYGGGARAYVMGKIPTWPRYQLQFGYEGIEEWNAALLYPQFDPFANDLPELMNPDFTGPVDPEGDPEFLPNPADPDDVIRATRSLHYRSSFHSAEFNFYRRPPDVWRPFWGIRYLRLKDTITDVNDQFAPPPAMGDPDVVTTDIADFIDIKNNLVGFQLGLREDMWHCNDRLSLQGFLNAGVYYNHIQFADRRVTTMTTQTPDDSTTLISSNVSSSEPSDIAYVAEASITGICRLNRCWALRGGYQVLWIDGLRLAEDVYLNDRLDRHDLVLHGWHVGLECRR